MGRERVLRDEIHRDLTIGTVEVTNRHEHRRARSSIRDCRWIGERLDNGSDKRDAVAGDRSPTARGENPHGT
jgi:hypothetical protein